MQAETFLRNKVKRQILWNGQDFEFKRFAENEYHELQPDVEQTFKVRGVFHEGGGYGGMLNYELYEREGSRELSKMKPMILCLVDEVSKELKLDDKVVIGEETYFVIGKNDIKNMGIVYDISLETVQNMEN